MEMDIILSELTSLDTSLRSELDQIAKAYGFPDGYLDFSDLEQRPDPDGNFVDLVTVRRKRRLVGWGRLLSIGRDSRKVSYITHFLALDDIHAGTCLLQRLSRIANDHGSISVMGPMSPDISVARGVLISDAKIAPALGLARNPLYISSMFESAGFSSAMDMWSYRIMMRASPRIRKVTERIRTRFPNLRLRSLDVQDVRTELTIIAEIYNQAWSSHWEFTPLQTDSLESAFNRMRPYLVPESILFVRSDLHDIGMLVAVPNVFDERRSACGRPISFRGMLFGIRPEWQNKGIHLLLFDEAERVCRRQEASESEIGWVLDSNSRWVKQIENAYAEDIIERRLYRIFEQSLVSPQ